MDFPRLAVPKSATGEPKQDLKARTTNRVLKLGLRSKLLILVVSIALGSVLISSFILLDFQRLQLIQNAQTSTTVLSGTLEANLHHAMLTHDWSMVNNIVRGVAADKTIGTIRILDTKGMVSTSSLPGEVGTQLNRTDPMCKPCHNEGVLTSNKTVVLNKATNPQSLLNVYLIENQAECHRCHAPEERILGLLMIETPMTSLNNQLSTNFRQIMLLALGTSVLLIGLIVPALNRYVVQPVEELSKGTAEISAGNLEYQVKVVNRDELGELAESFDGMRQQLKASMLEMERRNQELEVLNDVALTVSQSLDLQQVLAIVLETVAGKLGMETGLIFLLDDMTGRFKLCASRGASSVMCQEIERRRNQPSGDISGQVARTDQPYYVANIDADSRLEGLWDDPHNRSYINVPLRSKGKVIGTMVLVSYAGEPVTERAVAVIEAVGNEIGIVIENAQLYRQLRYLAVLDERDRLAREMHDHLAQGVGYLSVKASMTDDLLSSGQIDQAQVSLSELRKVAKLVYTDVREAIFNLRTQVSSKVGLLPTLQDYLAEYRTHYGLDAHLVIDGDGSVELSSEVASQLLRIIQEALTNVRKHAGSSKAWIRCRQADDQICISIEDDGRGFYPPETLKGSGQHYGLQIMRERAESVGGDLELESQPGQGTRVIVRMPLFY